MLLGRPVATAVVALGVIALPWHARLEAQSDGPVAVLERVASYLEDYDRAFSAVIFQEQYSQTETTLEGNPATTHARVRDTKSQLLLLNAGAGQWLCFRDIFEVDGKELSNHVERLARLLASSPADSSGAGSLAAQITSESARYNLGGIMRNFNVPTMALSFLRRPNQGRSTFRVVGTRNKGKHDEVVEVAFVERVRPTLVRGAKEQDVPATGRFWIEPSGRIDRTEISLKTDNGNGVNAVVTVEFGVQPKLDLVVPLSMHEHYDFTPLDRIETFATYSNFVVPQIRVSVSGFKEAAGRFGGGGGW